jgi:hypothetical protein
MGLQLGDLNEANTPRHPEAEGVSGIRYDYPPGTVFGDHKHGVDQKDAVVSGYLLISAEGREFSCTPVTRCRFQREPFHSAEVIGNEAVIGLDGTRY